MNEQLYQHLVTIIKEHSIHVTVKDATYSQTFMYTIAGRTYNRIVPCMILCVNRPFDIYIKGHEWKIPVHEIQRSIKILSKEDLSFKTRLASRRLDRFDLKRIIQLATHDVVQLCLIDNSLPYLFGTIR